MAIGDETNESTSRHVNVLVAPTIFPTIVHNHPLFLQPTDTSGLLGKSKLGFVDDRYPKSKFEPEFHEQREKVNAVVLSWIMNAMCPGLLSSVVYASNAHKVWEDLKERFDKFLMGLNDTYSQAQSQIMMMSPMPSIKKAYSLLMDVESQRNLANFSQMMQVAEVADNTALHSNKNPTTGNGHFRAQKKIVVCDFCNYKGHIKENYFKLIRYPQYFKSNFKTKKKRGNSGAYANHVNTAPNYNPTMQNTHTQMQFGGLQGRGEGIIRGLQQMQVPSSTGF
uniref:Retrotransposon Copia-like N-terminal domain-containing protein n=1 Tax=Nicotiana tabacum TaxID=4097 RepID=A0A1S3Z3F3_TOBAC|nr:PREDICTED: uncharacterized protein LOC107782579 [Nicotiana tabacum]